MRLRESMETAFGQVCAREHELEKRTTLGIEVTLTRIGLALVLECALQ